MDHLGLDRFGGGDGEDGFGRSCGYTGEEVGRSG